MPIYEWNFTIGKQTDFPPYKTLDSMAKSAQTNPPNTWNRWAQNYSFDNTAVYLNMSRDIFGFDMYDGSPYAPQTSTQPAPLFQPNIPNTARVGTDPGNLSYSYIDDRIYLFPGLPRYLIEVQKVSDFLLSLSSGTAFGRARIDRINDGTVEYIRDNQEWLSPEAFGTVFGNYLVITDIKIFASNGQYLGSFLEDTFVPVPYVRCGFNKTFQYRDGAPQEIYGGQQVFYFNTLSSLLPHRTGDWLYILSLANGDVPNADGFLYGAPNNLSAPLLIFGSGDDLKSTLNTNGSITWTTDPDAVVDPNAEMENPDYIGPQYNPSGGEYIIGGGDEPKPEGTIFNGGNYDPNSVPITTGDIKVPGFMPSQSSGLATWAVSGDELFSVTQEIFKPELDLTKIFISKEKAFVNAFYLPFDIVAHDPAHCALMPFSVGYASTSLQLYRLFPGYNNLFDGGSVNVREYYGTFLDYDPYTTVTLYIPYIGYHQLATNQVMNMTVNLKYSVDLTLGILTAYVFAGSKLINVFSGQMGIPTSINGMDLAEGFQSLVKFIGLTTAAVPVIASSAAGIMESAGGMIENATASSAVMSGTLAGVLGGAAVTTMAGASATNPSPKSMGTAGAENWLSAYQTPYVLIERRESATPAGMVDLEGFASCYTGLMSEFTGFVQCSTVKLETGAGMTEQEMIMIVKDLQGGVYID